MEEATRRELMKRLGLVALAGYVAPSVAVVRDALADDDDRGKKKRKRKKKRPPPSDFDHDDQGEDDDFD